MKLLLGLAMLVLCEIALRTIDGSTEPLPAKLPERSLHEIPLKFSAWTGHDIPLDAAIFARTGSAAMLNRAYLNPIGDEVAINLGIWTDPQIGFPHKPEECYPGAGWEIVARKLVSVPVPNGSISARLLTLDKADRRIYVLYWAECNGQILLDNDGMRLVRQSLRGKNSLRPVVKAMLQSGHADAIVAERQLVNLASQLAPELESYK